MKNIAEFIAPYRINKGKKFKLSDHDPGNTGDLDSESKDDAKELMQRGTKLLTELQDKLYAQDCWAVLLIFQAMDAAGKDGAIKHVMSGVNPQGCQVFSFKAPSTLELDHDYMWRTSCCLPERGRIGIFNRSYYEEVLVARVHPEILAKQHLPPKLVHDDIWEQRFDDIAEFEKYLARNGVCIRKFFLNVSKKEQRKRFLARLDDPEKNWKFSAGDVRERKYWNDYMKAYEELIQHTAREHAPWFVVPADNKWFTRLVVMGAVVDALQSLGVKYPKVTDEQKKQLELARAELE